MLPLERRAVDGRVTLDGNRTHLVEVDEAQHFNRFRALTLERYPADAPLAFPQEIWLAASRAKSRLEGGGFGKPKPPLFAMELGRHRQRAFRDALADLLPPLHGYAPTLRIADFEVEPWVWGSAAVGRMRELVEDRLSLPPVAATHFLSSASPDRAEDESGESALRRGVSPGAGGARTQRVTAVDFAAGRIRLPEAAKHEFPTTRSDVVVVLRGRRIVARYDPRNGPPSRSGVLGIGRNLLAELVAEDEVLSVSRGLDGVMRLE